MGGYRPDHLHPSHPKHPSNAGNDAQPAEAEVAVSPWFGLFLLLAAVGLIMYLQTKDAMRKARRVKEKRTD